MSWFTDITGKAENLLTKLDQTAATALHTDTGFTENAAHQSQLQSHDNAPLDNYQRQAALSYSVSVPANLNSAKLPAQATKTASKTGSFSSSSSKEKADPDDALLAFLNSPENSFSAKNSSGSQHSRQSSSSFSTKSQDLEDHVLRPTETLLVESFLPKKIETDVAMVTTKTSTVDDFTMDQENQLSVYMKENRMLKAEVSSLNQEMTSLVTKAKESQSEVIKLKEKITSYNHSASNADQMVRELQARETDLTEALLAKDSQLAVLRVRLEEADRELSERKKVVQSLQTNNTQILQDQHDSSGVQRQAIESLQLKLDDLQRALVMEQDASKTLSEQSSQRQTSLETEQKNLTDALAAAHRKLDDEKARCTQMTNQMRISKSNLQHCQQELTDYKDKATRILQSKERLIATLREGSGASGEATGVSQLEYDAVKQERDMFREDLLQYKIMLDTAKLDFQELEETQQIDNDRNQEHMSSMEDVLQEERHKVSELTGEVDSVKMEMQYTIEDLNKQKSLMQARIDERELEIDRLRVQLTTKSLSTTTESELESRVRALTESLIQKQTTLEALSTEKTSLSLQLERLNQKYEELQSIPSRNTATVTINDEEEAVRLRGGGFLRENMTDAPVTRKVKRAANMIDRFSIRLGVFLRRYPIARVVVVVYMAFLHLWVTFVLLKYQPEIHGAEIDPKPPQ